MEEYDVTIIGGGVAGSVAARFSAQHGFKTLLVEKYKTPRNNKQLTLSSQPQGCLGAIL